jgi:hypothetical protein
MTNVTKEHAQEVAVDYLKKLKGTDTVNVSTVEQKGDDWEVRGTTPLDLEGHPWAEKFEVVIDLKGKIKAAEYSLL